MNVIFINQVKFMHVISYEYPKRAFTELEDSALKILSLAESITILSFKQEGWRTVTPQPTLYFLSQGLI